MFPQNPAKLHRELATSGVHFKIVQNHIHLFRRNCTRMRPTFITKFPRKKICIAKKMPRVRALNTRYGDYASLH